MSVISQDTPKDQMYSFVEKSSSGKLGTRDNIIHGVPAFFTTQVVDDTKKVRYEEKNRRFVHVTPDTTREKIRAANILTGHRDGLLEEEYDELVVSREDKDRAKQILKILVAKLKQHSKHFQPKRNGVKIPFEETITHSIPNDHLWDMTVTNRTTKYLATITKTRMDARPKIVNEDTGQFYPITTFEDLKEAFELMQIGASGVRPYLSSWYNKYFIPAIDTLNGEAIKDKDGTTKELYVGFTNKKLTEITHKNLSGPKIGTDELYNKYLSPLINLGIIDKARSEIDGRENIYFPVENDKAERVGNLFSMFENDKDLRLKVSDPGIFPSKTFLKSKFRIGVEYRQREDPLLKKNFSRYKLVDTDGKEITIDQLLDKYYSNPELCFIKDYKEPEKNFVFSSPVSDDNLIEFHNNTIEDSDGNNASDNEKTTAAITNGDATRSEPIIPIKEFFFDDPALPYRSLPPHTLEQSPCYSIIGSKFQDESEGSKGVKWYYCRLHPTHVNINLESIEHHCKHKEPEAHKAEILKLLQSPSVGGGGGFTDK